MKIPQQRDIIFIDFDPSLGKEIQKRRPGIVVTNNEFNKRTGFCYVCPISSTKRKAPLYVDLIVEGETSGISGQISVHQMRSMDYTKRKFQKVAVCDLATFSAVLERIEAFVSLEN
ncbi:type II toxin-antitoxin system PemK/MazF family toxin [Enterococcus sp. 2201sp1_2201st1_B8_2201SCRN_220225]|uniref:type II toxin-antitoxin system PemK/MazF family toxin n=1 Tax=unclassified Enterococcus TaxID=2608891 RepID=UPI0034A4A52F